MARTSLFTARPWAGASHLFPLIPAAWNGGGRCEADGGNRLDRRRCELVRHICRYRAARRASGPHCVARAGRATQLSVARGISATASEYLATALCPRGVGYLEPRSIKLPHGFVIACGSLLFIVGA